MLELYQLSQRLAFPHPKHALEEPNGLLAFGGDLSIDRLELAYRNGIFPWFNEGEPILWWSPNPRGVLFPEHFHCSRSLTKFIRRHHYTITLNHAFPEVITACATVRRGPALGADSIAPAPDDGSSHTWITDNMIEAYIKLHQANIAHSIEVWDNQQLVGGLYGIALGGVFCGESMFHYETNTSKLAFATLVALMKRHGMTLIDCQLPNPHLHSLGCESLARDAFLQRLKHAQTIITDDDMWQAREITELSRVY
ncbi:leucyl/phenylalanyl-tRNA--protein transferase [Aestuariibacter salexigens]|uniref:leucyl/phenylalanyl-tRNA--protein transferase n=1 Tax=Aestuariibacter salexigens TaxID=226010 RepID=UPI00041519E4|nr:leucyl/phenylalanyl-tRNA--protein transferase [Aestuariibacter salexigens]